MKVPMINSPARVFNLASLRIDRLTRRGFLPFLLFFRAALYYLMLSRCCLIWCSPCFQRAGCSTPGPPHLSPPWRLLFLLTWHLLTSLLSILQSPRFLHRSPILAADQKTGRLLGWNPVSATTPAHHDQKQHTGEDSTPHIPGTGNRNGVPGTGTFARAFGCYGYLPGYDSNVACTTGLRPPHPGSRGVFRFVFLSNMCMCSVNIRFLRLLRHVRCRGVCGEVDCSYLQLSPWPVRAVRP